MPFIPIIIIILVVVLILVLATNLKVVQQSKAYVIERLEGISSVMLSKSLEELERARLVHREQYPEIPPRVEYSLTALGRSIDPYLRALGEWGMQAYEAIQAG